MRHAGESDQELRVVLQGEIVSSPPTPVVFLISEWGVDELSQQIQGRAKEMALS